VHSPAAALDVASAPGAAGGEFVVGPPLEPLEAQPVSAASPAMPNTPNIPNIRLRSSVARS